MLYTSIFLFLLMLAINFIFKIASVFRLGVPLLYVLLVGALFPNFVQKHEMLTTLIFLALLGLVALSWVAAIRRKIRHRREQKENKYYEDINT